MGDYWYASVRTQQPEFLDDLRGLLRYRDGGTYYNYCTGITFTSRTSTSPGGRPDCYLCNLVVDLLDQAYQCGYYKIIGWQYSCNDSFYGDIYKNYLRSGWLYSGGATWYKVAPSITVKATDASNGTVTNNASPPTTYATPVHDRPYGGHNSPIKVYNITISSSVATDIRIDHGAFGRSTYFGPCLSMPEAARLLPDRPADATDEDLVFRGRDGGALKNNLDRAWRAARERASLPWLRIHDLRHEAASRFLEAGGTLRELQVLGGWSSLELVERYSKVDQERIRRTLARVPLPSAECTVSAPTPLAAVVGLAK
ncbi:MAG TPA: tyrosine-type recombinase/integrase [Thermoanaerobaculia bacterium]|jgi:hypothetical protein|nr:tyrosine-type recombinase/integrase [Thermoanaerobaculia bacterium]